MISAKNVFATSVNECHVDQFNDASAACGRRTARLSKLTSAQQPIARPTDLRRPSLLIREIGNSDPQH
jgi:hypothetical protein